MNNISMNNQLFDIQKLSAFAGLNDPAGLFVLLNAFRKDIPSIVVAVDVALQQNDFDSLTKLAHGAKGVSGSFTADKLVFLLNELETASGEENLNMCKELFQHIFLETQLVLHSIHLYMIEHELYKELNLFDEKYMLIDADIGSQITTKKHLQKIGIDNVDIFSSIDESLMVLKNNPKTHYTIICSDSIPDSESVAFIKSIRMGEDDINQKHYIIKVINDVSNSFSPLIRLDVNALAPAPIKRKELLRIILELKVLKISNENWLQDQEQYEQRSSKPVEPNFKEQFSLDISKLGLNDILDDNLFYGKQLIAEKDTRITMNCLRIIMDLEQLSQR